MCPSTALPPAPAAGAKPQLQLCSALLTFQWLVLGVLVPLLLTLRWARPPLAAEAASNPQRGGVWGAVSGRVARGFAACDSVLQWSAAGEGVVRQRLLQYYLVVACWCLAKASAGLR